MIIKKHESLPRIFNKFLKEETSIEEPHRLKYFISGGALIDVEQGTHFNDLDIYFEDSETFNFLKEELDKLTEVEVQKGGLFSSLVNVKLVDILHESENAITYNILINGEYITTQFIRRSFGTPEHILSNFDLTLLRRWITPIGELFESKIYHPSLTNDYRTRCHESTLSRMLKYQYRDFHLDIEHFIDTIRKCLEQEYLDPYYTDSGVVPAITTILNNSKPISQSRFSASEMVYIYSQIFKMVEEAYMNFCTSKKVTLSDGVVDIEMPRLHFVKCSARAIFESAKEFKEYKEYKDYINIVPPKMLVLIHINLRESVNMDDRRILHELERHIPFTDYMDNYPELII